MADSVREFQPDSKAPAITYDEIFPQKTQTDGMYKTAQTFIPEPNNPGVELPSLSITQYFEQGKVYADKDNAMTASFAPHGDSLVVKGKFNFKDNQGRTYSYPYDLATDGKESHGSFTQQWSNGQNKINCSYPIKMRILDAETVQVFMPETVHLKTSGPLRCPDYSSFYGWRVRELHPQKTKK